jgi:hypothetical protein
LSKQKKKLNPIINEQFNLSYFPPLRRLFRSVEVDETYKFVVKCQAVYNKKYMQLSSKSKTGITSKELDVHVTVVPTDTMSTFNRVLGNF